MAPDAILEVPVVARRHRRSHLVWSIALVHGFKVFYCVKQAGHTFTSHDLEFRGHAVLWLAPLVVLLSLWLVRASKHYRFWIRQSTRRPVAPGQPLGQRTAQMALPTADHLPTMILRMDHGSPRTR